MALPIIPLPSSTVEVNGSPVTFRSLSRSEALKLQDYRGREDEAETLIIQWACDVDLEEAQAWRERTMTAEAGKLVDAILIFSGLADADEKTGEPIDPKADTNGHSRTESLELTRS